MNGCCSLTGSSELISSYFVGKQILQGVEYVFSYSGTYLPTIHFNELTKLSLLYHLLSVCRLFFLVVQIVSIRPLHNKVSPPAVHQGSLLCVTHLPRAQSGAGDGNESRQKRNSTGECGGQEVLMKEREDKT